MLPQAGKAKGPPVAQPDVKALLPPPQPLPLIKAIRHDETPADNPPIIVLTGPRRGE